ncbi:MAG: ribosomal L7Ae/L30e/S12e/Gadd45 family protein [Candidatus Woesearchaeota archaeon]
MDIKKLAQAGQLIIGKDRTLKTLREGGLQAVILAQNAPPLVRTEVMHLSAIANVPVHPVPQTNQELGTLCRKGYAVSVLGHKK